MRGDYQKQLPMLKFSPEAAGLAPDLFNTQRYIKVANNVAQADESTVPFISVIEFLSK
jgi:hypothetical protein